VDKAVRWGVGVAAALAGGVALIQSTGAQDVWPFMGWDAQYLRDFSVLMVAYVFLCLVKQQRRSFLVDALVLFVSFIAWAAGFLLFIRGTDTATGALFSFAAITITLAFAVLGPILKGDTTFIWEASPTSDSSNAGASDVAAPANTAA
jgi:hypothetical protein